ncbi:hypothetical protein DACRYDRAFT_101973 [Dacryopinax primogenitus]|uniref:Thioredoxin-like fold domain-containing protein n=1 Tax=Dacryopinax primogenitus (strain DJM 731) TaxID=1858805 RepID=M5FNX3_DACPD|nr:uncharacterized protein DACRYDRAFT_101973 [Dacryopinax primogenitus]EJT98030.1 hypothetical protein DACRYDRAFT_101973 [Dacryopinax primogenitus]
MSIKLHNFGEPASMPKHSYFCQKLETYFRAAGWLSDQDYVTVPHWSSNVPTRSVKDFLQIPFVTFEDDCEKKQDFRAVRELVGMGMLKDLDAGLSAERRVDTKVWQIFIEESVFPATLLTRYRDEKNWPVFLSESVELGIPFLADGSADPVSVRQHMLIHLRQHGISRYDKYEIADQLEDAVRNIEVKLLAIETPNGYVYGGLRPTSLDVILYSWLASVLSTKCNQAISFLILNSPRLRSYVQRLTQLWFPEYELLLDLTSTAETLAIRQRKPSTMTLTLHVFPHAYACPNISYYCQKLETYLRAAGYKDYRESVDGSTNGPKGKIPFVVFPSGEKLGDTYFIMRHLVSQGTIRDLDADAGLSKLQKADARAWVAQVDEFLYPLTCCTLFLEKENYAELCLQMFGEPSALRRVGAWWVQRDVHKFLWQHGVGRHSPGEWRNMLSEFLENVVARLEGSKYMFGERPTSADVVVYAWLVTCLETRGTVFVQKWVLGNAPLKTYVKGLTEAWFPEYDGILRLVV